MHSEKNEEINALDRLVRTESRGLEIERNRLPTHS